MIFYDIEVNGPWSNYCAQLANAKSEDVRILNLSFLLRHLLIDTI